MRHVVATAGHVDHGKSTLVRALTGREPDRLDEERRRGLTIELGFAWMTLPSGADLAFVDVPGHRRFIGTMLSGLGPAPAVLLVVAADQGWQPQTSEHLDAVAALGLRDLLLVVTRDDLADPAPTLDEATERLAARGWPDVPSLTVSARTGSGLDDLRAALDALLAQRPAPDLTAPVRLWVDRSFSVGGAGTVVTGTLGAGSLRVDDELLAMAADGTSHLTTVRGLHSEDRALTEVTPVSRAAVNLRRVGPDDIGRGSVLLTPGSWHLARAVDLTVEPITPPASRADLPGELTVHLGTADHAGVVRPLGPDHARVRTEVALPWRVGDRLVLRDAGSRRIWGATVVDVDPLPLRRRGAAQARGTALAAAGAPDQRRALRLAEHEIQPQDLLARLGLGSSTDSTQGGERVVGGLVVDPGAWTRWTTALTDLVTRHHEEHPLSPGIPTTEAATHLRLPVHGGRLVPALAEAAGLDMSAGRVRRPEAATGLGPAEPAVARLEARLRESPFAAPERDDLTALGLGAPELAAAARLGRLLRLPDEVVLLPDAPARAMRELTRLAQPFTLSQARQSLGTTRRVAVPLLEHLDGRGWTRRVDGQHREVVR